MFLTVQIDDRQFGQSERWERKGMGGFGRKFVVWKEGEYFLLPFGLAKGST